MKKILVVGGSHLKYFVKALKEAGFEVTRARDVGETLELLGTHQPDNFHALITQLENMGDRYRVPLDHVEDFMIAGIMIKHTAPLHPRTKFLLLGGKHQGYVAASNQIVFLPTAIKLDLKDLVEHVCKATAEV